MTRRRRGGASLGVGFGYLNDAINSLGGPKMTPEEVEKKMRPTSDNVPIKKTNIEWYDTESSIKIGNVSEGQTIVLYKLFNEYEKPLRLIGKYVITKAILKGDYIKLNVSLIETCDLYNQTTSQINMLSHKLYSGHMDGRKQPGIGLAYDVSPYHVSNHFFRDNKENMVDSSMYYIKPGDGDLCSEKLTRRLPEGSIVRGIASVNSAGGKRKTRRYRKQQQ
jgi:hypothetical protein